VAHVTRGEYFAAGRPRDLVQAHVLEFASIPPGLLEEIEGHGHGVNWLAQLRQGFEVHDQVLRL